jgi:hypothetical protein
MILLKLSRLNYYFKGSSYGSHSVRAVPLFGTGYLSTLTLAE